MTTVTKIGPRLTFTIFLLAIAGQIAWAIENNWFNVFVFDIISPNPDVVAWMVAVSAATATITSLIMGTLSDHTITRMGKRKPYIFFGYVIWGIVTALFPTVAYIQIIGIAVVMVVIVDAIMTFFGSTANDAAFNAWITDISDPTNRGRIQGILSVATLLANLIAIGIAGFIIEDFGYFAFFYILGGFVTLVGIVSGLLVKEPHLEFSSHKAPSLKEVIRDMIDSFRPNNLKANKILYILLIFMALNGIGDQVSAPYSFVYIENYLGIGKEMISVIGAIVVFIAAVIVILVSLISHRINRHTVLICVTICSGISLIIFSLVKSIVWVTAAYCARISFLMLIGMFMESWMQDLYPVKNRGKFQGIRMIFFVALPMIIGPPIGAAIIRTFGIPTWLNGEAGFIPTPEIFIFGGLIGLLCIIPLLFIKNKEGKIKIQKNEV